MPAGRRGYEQAAPGPGHCRRRPVVAVVDRCRPKSLEMLAAAAVPSGGAPCRPPRSRSLEAPWRLPRPRLGCGETVVRVATHVSTGCWLPNVT